MTLVEGNVCQYELSEEMARLNPKPGGDKFQLSESELCAGVVGSCSDIDGGAPLVCQSEMGRWSLVGIFTWGLGCSRPDMPRVFLNISKIETWIKG